MNPVELLLSKLPDARKAGNGWSARCPAHEDRKASLSISAGDDGAALVKCHAGCDTAAVLSAIGLVLADLFAPKAGAAATSNGKPASAGRAFAAANDAVSELERNRGKRSALWTYHNAAGEPVGVVIRWDKAGGKDIRPIARHANGWRSGAMPDPRPLYGLPELTDAKRVIVCEGEKAADMARAWGFVATTSAGGSQAAAKTDWGPLAGKEVWILPDNDAPGRKYAETVAGILGNLTPAPAVRIVELPGLPDKGDIVDWIEAHGDAAEADAMRAEIEALAEAVEPWRPDDADDLAFRPIPLEALPQPIRGFVGGGALAIGCDPSYLALPLLTALGAAIGNTWRLELKRGWSAPAILWGAIVGESGTAKTPAFMLVMRPIHERQSKALRLFEARQAEYESALEAWDEAKKGERGKKPKPPACERSIVSDTTVEALAPILLENPRGLLLARDELAGWIGSFDRYAGKGKAGGDSANWLSMFSAGSITVDRKTSIPRIIRVPQAAVCICGGIQPATLQRALSVEHRESGLAARLLMAYPPRKAKRWTEADIDPGAEAELARLFDRLYELKLTEADNDEPRPALVRLSHDAKTAWTMHYNAHADEQAALSGDVAAAWSKLEEYPARLALVVHFARWAANDPTLANPEILDAASMGAGITLANWFKHEARRVYALLDESEGERGRRRLVEWIGRKGGTVTAREVRQGCRWLKEPGKAEEALEELVKAGRGGWQNSATTPQGGRPGRAFVLSTPSTVYKTSVKTEGFVGLVDVDAIDAPIIERPNKGSDSELFGGSSSHGPYSEGY